MPAMVPWTAIVLGCALLASCGGPEASEPFEVRGASLQIDPATLTRNPSFETSLAGWYSYQSDASLVTTEQAPHGRSVARVAHQAGSDVFTLDTREGYGMPTAGVGARYLARAYVRAASSFSEGRSVFVTLRERGPAQEVVQLEESYPYPRLTAEFQPIETELTVRKAGSTLEVYVGQFQGRAGDAFEVDLVTVVRVGSDAPSPAPPLEPDPAIQPPAGGCAASPGSPLLWALLLSLGTCRKARPRR